MSNKYILVIVESPGKIKKIQSYLGDKYLVAASYGHIIDLDESKMSVDLTTFEPSYTSLPRQAKIIQDLKTKAKNASKILLASDEDREGESIAWSIAKILNIKDPIRIAFNSITKDDLLNAIANPRSLDYNLIDAQKARRVLDRIVGYELSPLLWKQVKANLSAGRVQSVVVKIIVEREREITNFFTKAESYFYKVKANLNHVINKKTYTLNYNLYNTNNKSKQANISSYDDARSFLSKSSKSTFKIVNITEKKKLSNASAPFTTSSMQQEAFQKLGFSVQRTMSVAQKLYEDGHITYMRTDSVTLSKEALTNIQDYVVKTFGDKYYNKQANYASKKNNTQEAHEAVRPTKINVVNITSSNQDNIKLYNLIWKRAVSSQMTSAEYLVTQIQADISKESKYMFMSETEKLVFEGYLKVYDLKDQEEEDQEEVENTGQNSGDAREEVAKKIVNIPPPKLNQELILNNITSTQTYEKPPSRYNEGTLTKKLDPDNLNIGRPATTAGIITKIQERNYVKLQDIPGVEKDVLILNLDNNKKIIESSSKILLGKETNKFTPTSIGILVTDYLEANFSKILDYKFTEHLEVDLDKIANASLKYKDVMSKFYKEFHELITTTQKAKNVIQDKYTRTLGKYLDTECDIIATIGYYGPLVKLVSLDKNNKVCKNKQPAPIKEPLTLESITLEQALVLLEYPKDLGKYENKPVLLKTGQYGFYISYNKKSYSLGEEKDITKFDLKKAIAIIQDKKSKSLGEFTEGTKTYTVLNGQYGHYISVKDSNKIKKAKNVNVKLPEDTVIEELDLNKVKEIITNYYEKRKTRFQKKDVKVDKEVVEKEVEKEVKKEVKRQAPKNKIKYASEEDSKKSSNKTKKLKNINKTK